MESCAAPDVDAELGEVEAVEDAEADADARADSGAANGDEEEEEEEEDDDDDDDEECVERSFFAARFGIPPLSTSAASNIGRVQKRARRLGFFSLPLSGWLLLPCFGLLSRSKGEEDDDDDDDDDDDGGGDDGGESEGCRWRADAFFASSCTSSASRAAMRLSTVQSSPVPSADIARSFALPAAALLPLPPPLPLPLPTVSCAAIRCT